MVVYRTDGVKTIIWSRKRTFLKINLYVVGYPYVLQLKFTDGWFRHFKAAMGYIIKRHGEAKSADFAAAEECPILEINALM